jgi:FemAB family protein
VTTSPRIIEAWQTALRRQRLSAVPLNDDEQIWSRVCAACDFLPVAYTPAWVRYQLTYLSAFSDDVLDLSCTVMRDQEPLAVIPLVLRCVDGAWALGSNEGPVLRPLFVSGKGEKTRRLIYRALFEVFAVLNTDLWCSEILLGGGFDDWHHQVAPHAQEIRVLHELYVDLLLEPSVIWSNVRRSYKSLISEARRLWVVQVQGPGCSGAFEEFRLLHLAVAGRETRSRSTWEMQRDAINSKAAFLITLREPGGRLVGGGFFHISAHEGVYAVGAYDRTLFDKPLGHAVQVAAIEYMQSQGLRWYKIGRRPYTFDHPTPSTKELSIGLFKAGFATHVFPRIESRIRIEGSSFAAAPMPSGARGADQ